MFYILLRGSLIEITSCKETADSIQADTNCKMVTTEECQLLDQDAMDGILVNWVNNVLNT